MEESVKKETQTAEKENRTAEKMVQSPTVQEKNVMGQNAVAQMEMEQTALEQQVQANLTEMLALPKMDVRTYSPLVLAYIGDAVYEILVRTRVVSHGSMQVNKMHKKSASLVKAETQANLAKLLMDDLTPEESAVYRRGRNVRSATMAKHATMIDYRMATGFEALMGYLYLMGRYDRVLKLVHDGFEKIGEIE